MAGPHPPKHFTRESWKVVPIAAVAVGLLPLLKYGKVQEANTSGLSLPILMLAFASAGAVAGALLTARSHIRSTVWSAVVLWAGMLIVALSIAWASLVLGTS